LGAFSLALGRELALPGDRPGEVDLAEGPGGRVVAAVEHGAIDVAVHVLFADLDLKAVATAVGQQEARRWIGHQVGVARVADDHGLDVRPVARLGHEGRRLVAVAPGERGRAEAEGEHGDGDVDGLGHGSGLVGDWSTAPVRVKSTPSNRPAWPSLGLLWRC